MEFLDFLNDPRNGTLAFITAFVIIGAIVFQYLARKISKNGQSKNDSKPTTSKKSQETVVSD